ncbi:unnamed protein product [Bubo scandiacus]
MVSFYYRAQLAHPYPAMLKGPHMSSSDSEAVCLMPRKQVSKAEGILLQVKNALDEEAGEVALQGMMIEYYQVTHHKSEIDYKVSKKLLSRKHDLRQLARSSVNQEFSYCAASHSVVPSLQKLAGKFSACQGDCRRVYRVSRVSETAEFLSSRSAFDPYSMYHVCNFMGILSRGLLMPKVIVEDHDLVRTDIGNLGSGSYFSDSVRFE